MARIPRELDWLNGTARGRAWLRTLPATVHALADSWELDLGEPFADSYVSLVVPAKNLGLVLKIQYPHRESEFEAAALQLWDGAGAVRLVDHDSANHALLLERCIPGDHLSTAGPEVGLTVLTGLLPLLWLPAGKPFGTLADEVESWVSNLPGEWEEAGRPFERSLLDGAIETLTDLAGSQGEQVLLHQDLHGDNVLAARREPWLAIDPKPLVGEREFGLSPIIRSSEFGHSSREVVRRLDRLTSELGVDRERSRLWAFGHAVAWGFEGGELLPRHLETARWLLAG